MIHEEIRERLDDYVDGSLSGTDRAAIQDHLERCEVCRADVAALEALLADSGRLPRVIEPPRDLWPGIDRRLDDARRILARRWLPLAAAAVIALVSTVTVLELARRGGEGVRPRPVATPQPWRGTDSEYRRAVAELREALAVTARDLAPETRAEVDRNLKIIDGAIEETRAALARDPGDPGLHELLRAAYQKKLEVLQRATGLAAET